MESIHNIPTLLPENLQAKIAGYRDLGNIPLLPAAALGALLFYLVLLSVQRERLQAPLLAGHLTQKEREKRFLEDAVTLMKEGYEKFKAGLPMYRVTTVDGAETVILSSRYTEEIKALPDSHLSFAKAVRESMAGKYCDIANRENPLAVHVIKADLTPSLPRLMPAISEEIDLALERVLPSCDDWTPVVAYSMLLDIVAQVSARVFVGEPLCRDPRWLQLSKDYTLLAFKASRAIKQWKPWMRPFVHRFLPELRELYRVRAEAIQFMTPVSQERQNLEIKRDDFTEWMKQKSSPGFAKDYVDQAYTQVQLAMAAIHTSTMSATHMVYDLVEHPEHVDMLREEIKSAVVETGGYQKDTMAKMKKLDSFMKESQRYNPPGLTTFMRSCLRDITLSDGTFLPKGTVIQIDSAQRYFDPEIFPNPDTFDPLRFYHLREAGDKNSHQFATSNSDYLHWGQGRHACPGRFFASNEVKTIISKLLLKYDFKPANAEAGRPKNFVFGTAINPNPMAQILVRRRKE
ncbi:Cytochrome P450 [Macrophomina phaseolina MS6]|uniref:Cytochrome P450 n=1 Tax=Macrophomina phaseolina (strain MS6) TaxID=1126212 RepID=K2RZE1_MACPH|nr:Cytochrome P450 [Macrophomina phaseolina MS6]